jgi:hypothetical protein
MHIDASRFAVDYIRSKGGHLFVWYCRMGDGSLIAHVGTARPRGRNFESHVGPEGIVVWFETDHDVEPVEVRIRRRPRPLGPIEVTWLGGPGSLKHPPVWDAPLL